MKVKSLALAILVGLAGTAGIQTAQSTTEVDRLLEEATDATPQGAEAAYQVGTLLLAGNGVPKDVERGLLYLERAANLNHVFANTALAQYYDEHQENPSARAKMLRFYQTAARLGDTNAQGRLGRLLLDAVAGGRIDASQVEQTRQLARTYLEWAAKHGNRYAQWELGQALRSGHGLDQDRLEARRWLSTAAEQGHSTAAYVVAIDYADANNPDASDQMALRWMMKAAELGHSPAMLALAQMFETGRNVPQDLAQAMTWVERARNAGAPGADDAYSRINSARLERLAHVEADAATIAQEREEQDRRALIASAATEIVRETAASTENGNATVVTSTTAAIRVPTTLPAAAGGLTLDQPLPIDEKGALAYITDLRSRIDALAHENADLRTQVASLTAERDEALARVAELDQRFIALRAEMEALRGGVAPAQQVAQIVEAPRPAAESARLLQRGNEAFAARDFAAASAAYTKAAELGDAEAINNLATLHMRGAGVAVDIDKAITMYERAARLGFAPAAQNLVFIYTRGEGVPINPRMAAQWQRRADELASVVSQSVAMRG
jgi:TPR repeat protein